MLLQSEEEKNVNKPNDYRGFSKFNHIKDAKLRSWNRLSTFFVITKDFGLSSAKQYLSQFSNKDKATARSILKDIKEIGYATTRRNIVQSLNPQH